jgi:hypothetical protein
MLWRRAEWLECQNVLQADEVSEAAACIGGIGMHRKSTEADRADRAMEPKEPAVNTKCWRRSKQSELVRTR